ncbi:MAG: hypothetical protein ACYCDV_06340 [Facklamia hominis]|nr:hypothetical protein [Facklamia hominis]EPH12139.1 hypothetical protein HMPREF9260_00704 [Facklamia hominis ACS-120-V-Sch10]
MTAFDLLLKTKRNNNNVFKENWNGLYHKDDQFTYSEATLIVPKKKVRK